MIEKRLRLGEQISKKPEQMRRALAMRVWNSSRERFGLHWSEESQTNLDRLDRMLETNSAVVYANHTSIKDVPVAISMVLSQLPNAKRILGPAGMNHYDLKRDPLAASAFRLLKLLNIQILPVVQVDDDTDYGEDQKIMIKNLKSNTEDAIRQPGSVVGIFPEGTRNGTDGTLQRAKRGIGHLEKYGPETFYLPVAIMHQKFTNQPEVIVDEPMQLGDIIPLDYELPLNLKEKAQVIADIHMKRLANLMPNHMRGVYA